MKPKWQKLASLAQKICTLWFQFFGAVFASNRYPFKNIFDVHLALCFKPILFFFYLILYIPSTIFQLNRGGSSWVEPELSYDKCVLLKDHNASTLVRLEPAAPHSRFKHSTTEPLRSPVS